jgi:hypothetical protein
MGTRGGTPLAAAVLVAALYLSCAAPTEPGPTEWAFDWACDIALPLVREGWDGWDPDTALIWYNCRWADEGCMLGRPRAESIWRLYYQNSAGAVCVVTVDPTGDAVLEELGVGRKVRPADVYPDAKLAEMMEFCLNVDEYWDRWDTDAWDYWWSAWVFYYPPCEGCVFWVDFYSGRDDESAWGWMGIDCRGSGDDYDIVYSY